VKYYLLHTPESQISNISFKDKPAVILQMVDVAEYLNQSGLVIQVDMYELYYSRQDVWAEKLQSAFYKALLEDLNSTGQRNYVAPNSPNAKFATASIKVELEHFHATDLSTVINSGRYYLSAIDTQHKTNNNAYVSSLNNTYYFDLALEKDGYTHAVEQLRKLISSLAKKIEKDIAALPNN
jgi:uncharacterized lipoprotein YmbA